MTIRKYLLAPRVYGSLLGIVQVLRVTRRRPIGIRIGVVWLAWAAAVVLAVLTVNDASAAKRTRTL
ncbi:hypothetical protein [Gryllotalpicola sp.]|uniref:hypothetical protein n=1 Tax=Gryllotalpicola sp. TaxID=1932787 RepID=UPI00260241DC|nr:hypothetical protein [Gryllotalpicola sp.]